MWMDPFHCGVQVNVSWYPSQSPEATEAKGGGQVWWRSGEGDGIEEGDNAGGSVGKQIGLGADVWLPLPSQTRPAAALVYNPAGRASGSSSCGHTGPVREPRRSQGISLRMSPTLWGPMAV